MSDKAAEFDGPNKLHIVSLHGDILKPEHDFILTEEDYNAFMQGGRHFWYQRLAQDYLMTCPIFIGSSLSEPILGAELYRATKRAASGNGRAFLITPDTLSQIKIENLLGKGIVHIQATLEEFSIWLQREVPAGWSPKEVVSELSKFPEQTVLNLTKDELSAAHSLREIDGKGLTAEYDRLKESQQDLFARQFLQGFPPTWRVAASTVPVWLDGTSSLYSALSEAIQSNRKLFVVTGQSGSGKTTALMQAVLKYSKDYDADVYAMDANAKPLSHIFALIKKLNRTKTILYVGDLFVYGDLFRSDLEALKDNNVIVVSTARTGEWREHLERYLSDIVKPFVFQRFVRKDFDPLIDRLVKYVPAPKFRRLERPKQHERLAASKSQLLIALREVTGSDNFTNIITSEFEGLPDADVKRLFIIAGLSTLARVGISLPVAKEAYEGVATTRTFDKALGALDGIILENENGRLVARHELYVRHILENVVEFEEIRNCIVSILKTYKKFNIPIIKSVSRNDSVLFRSIINHKFIADRARNYSGKLLAVKIYEEFEVDFQLDGHFWLQYALFLAGMQRLPDAHAMLRKSIDAYQNNAFAVHALADIELRLARERQEFDSITRGLIDSAVKILMLQDAQPSLDIDQYPIVTLVNGHIGALIKHNQKELAREKAKQYFERIKVLEKSTSSPALTDAKDKLLRLVTLGEWSEKNGGNRDRAGVPRRKHRRHRTRPRDAQG